jgi:hypothetical protein
LYFYKTLPQQKTVHPYTLGRTRFVDTYKKCLSFSQRLTKRHIGYFKKPWSCAYGRRLEGKFEGGNGVFERVNFKVFFCIILTYGTLTLAILVWKQLHNSLV